MPDTSRAIVALAIVLLAAVAAPRVALDFAPHGAAPEVVAILNFPPTGGGDPVDVTTRYVLPLETAIRSLGDVISTQGEVSTRGVSMTIRFHRGTDPELKAARLSSELAPLRAKLPERTHVDVWPSTDRGAQPSAIIALTDHDASRAAERVADDLRATPGVREVTIYGASSDEVDVRTFGSAPAGLADTIRHALTPHLAGEHVLSSAGATRVGDVCVNGQRLDAIATVRERRSELQNVARVGGRDAVVLFVVRDDDVSLFDFDRAVHATLRGHGTRDIENDAADLRALLLRVLLGAAVASLVLASAGRLLLAAYVPLAFAVMINICRVASLRIDALSLLAICGAIACIAPIAVWRAANREGGLSPLVIAACFAPLPLVATSLASDSLAAILTMPARLFALASLAALAAAAILPPGSATRAASGKLERRLLRASASVVLAAVAGTTFLLSWFGDGLDPRQSTRTPDRSRLYIRIGLPAGTPLTPTLATLTRVERALQDVEGFTHVWSYAGAGWANVIAGVAPDFQRPVAFELLRLRVEAAMPLGGGSVRVEQSYDSGAAVPNTNVEEPSADEQATRYRVLLKGTDANAMRGALEWLTTRLAQQGIHRNSIHAEWPEATTQLTLVPRPGITPQTAAQLAAALQERSYPPQRRSLPDGRALVAASLDAPVKDDDVPSAADLFSRPMPIPADAAFEVRREPVSGRVTRELGRFVLPITVGIDGYELEERKNKRTNVDRALSLMHFPAGIVLDRPSLGAWDFSREKLRLVGLAALLPSMLFALAAIVLSSIRRALLALAPALAGVACVSPALLVASASMDEVVLLIAGAAVCCVTALSTVALLHFTSVAAMYRVLRRAVVPCAIGTIAGAAMLFTASTAGRGLGEVWRAPLLAAAVVLAAGITAIVLPAALVSFRPLRGIASAPAATTAHFADNGTLAVRNLTKVYRGGFRALHGVSFELEPGVVGLLGPNGAGKTTLLRILTGLLLPTRGVVRYAGVEVRPETLPAYRERIGFLPQEFNAYAGLTAAQFLDYWALERGIAATRQRRAEVERLLAVARLEAHAGRKLRDFSGGMRQRIGIARAMIGDPPLLVVDEPTTGLDIEARGHFRELITSLATERIVILSTHIASDVEATAARLLLLSHGRLVWDGSPEALISRADGRVFETIVDDAAARELTRLHHITTRVRLAGGVRLRGIIAAGESLPGARVEATLEEAYLAEIAPRQRRAAGSFAFVYGGASSTSNDT